MATMSSHRTTRLDVEMKMDMDMEIDMDMDMDMQVDCGEPDGKAWTQTRATLLAVVGRVRTRSAAAGLVELGRTWCKASAHGSRRRNGVAKRAGGSQQVDGSGWVWRERRCETPVWSGWASRPGTMAARSEWQARRFFAALHDSGFTQARKRGR